MAWLTGWEYRKEITLADPSTDFQVCFTVNRSSGTDSGFTVYVGEAGCESDYDDIRFTEDDGSTLLDYWIETSTDSSATIWVKLAASADTTIYIYYKNASASAVSSGADTFIQYHGVASDTFHDANNIPGSSAYIVEARVKATSDTQNMYWGLTQSISTYVGGSEDYAVIQTRTDENTRSLVLYKTGGIVRWENPAFTNGVYYRIKIVSDGTNIYGYVDDDLISSGSTSIPDAALGLGFRIHNSYSGTGLQDWSFVRKYSATEPSITSYGAEEDNTVTITKDVGYCITFSGAYTKNVQYVIGNQIIDHSTTKNVTYTVGIYKAFRIVGIEFDSAKGLYTLEFGAVDDYYMSQDVKNKASLDIGHSLM